MSVIIASGEDEGERIDKVITRYFEGMSRSYLQKIIKDGAVFVNGRPVKNSYKVLDQDEIACNLPPLTEPEIKPENLPLDILYEDSDLLVVNKPKGMVVHPSPGHYSGTLVNALLYHCKGELSGINGVYRPGIVHRIDKDTTGSLIICKNEISHRSIAAQLKEHSVNRRYLAIAHGSFREPDGLIDAPIGRDPKDRKKMCVNEKNGKRAVTHYRVLRELNGYSYVECRLETGRTHQIRVRLTKIGHPLLGDTVYGNRPHPFHLTGQTLHASTIGFIHPRSGEYMEFEAPLPAYFSHLLEVLEH